MLSTRARKALILMGVTTKDQLNKMSQTDLLKYRGCGDKTRRELCEWSGWADYNYQKKKRVANELCLMAIKFLESWGYVVTKK